MTTTALASQWLLDTTRAFLSQENARGLYSEPTLGALPGGYDLHLAPPDEETALVLDGLLRLNDRDLITTQSQPGLREMLPARWLRRPREYVQHEFVEVYVYDNDLAGHLISEARRYGYEAVSGDRDARFTRYSRPVSYVLGTRAHTWCALPGELVFDPIAEYGTCRTALDLDRAAVFLQFIDPEAGRRRMIDVLALAAEDYRENER